MTSPARAARLDAGFALACAACAGALAVAAPLASGVATCVVLVALARRGRGALALAAALAFAAAGARAESALSAYHAMRSGLGSPTGTRAHAPAPWPARCIGAGRVVASPVRAGDGARLVIALDEASCEPERDGEPATLGRVAATLHADRGALAWAARGDRVRFVAQLAPTHLLRNPGLRDPSPAAARRGIVLSGAAHDVLLDEAGTGVHALVDRARARIRARIVATFPAETEAMARALVLGEDDVADEDRRAFQASGLSHLLAVSGMHLVLVVATLVATVRAVLARLPPLASRLDPGRVSALVGVPTAFLYAELAGGSGSAVRAAFMMATALLARAMARRASAWRALAVSILAMLAAEPLAPFDGSFALSITATLGLLVVSRRVDAALVGRLPRVLAWTRAPMAATVGASLACAPVLAGMAPELPLASVLANVVAVPVGEAVALPLCLAHAVLGPLPPVEGGAALAASGALSLVRAIARLFAALPGLAVPLPPPGAFQLAALASGAALVGVGVSRPRVVVLGTVLVLLVLEGAARRRGAPSGSLRITFLDVGQGDAALIDLPDGRALLVDGGGLVGSPLDTGERVVAPLLRARRRDALVAVVLSHPHPDHFLGLARGLARVRVGALWDTGQGEREGAGAAYEGLLGALRERGVSVLRPPDLCGTRVLGGATLDVLAPCPTPDPSRGANDNSFVIRVTFGARSVLLVGDAEQDEEAELLARARGLLRADVLKVGHHGSRTSTSPAFLEAVAPSYAVISSGVRNRFGHPHAVTLETLARAGARVLRTDQDGAVTVTTDGVSLQVSTSADDG